MTRPNDAPGFLRSAARIVGLAAIVLATASCGENEEESTSQPTTVRQPVEQRSPLEEIRLDPRVEFPRSREPSTVEVAEAVADFAAAFANGNARAASSMMAPADRAVLDRLQESGAWSESTGDVELVRVVSLSEGGGGGLTLGLAVQDAEGAYLLAWEGSQTGTGYEFTALPIESTSAANARALDGVDVQALLTR